MSEACDRATANGGHFEHLLQLAKQFAFFMCFGSSGFCLPSCQIFTVLMLDGG